MVPGVIEKLSAVSPRVAVAVAPLPVPPEIVTAGTVA